MSVDSLILLVNEKENAKTRLTFLGQCDVSNLTPEERVAMDLLYQKAGDDYHKARIAYDRAMFEHQLKEASSCA